MQALIHPVIRQQPIIIVPIGILVNAPSPHHRKKRVGEREKSRSPLSQRATAVQLQATVLCLFACPTSLSASFCTVSTWCSNKSDRPNNATCCCQSELRTVNADSAKEYCAEFSIPQQVQIIIVSIPDPYYYCFLRCMYLSNCVVYYHYLWLAKESGWLTGLPHYSTLRHSLTSLRIKAPSSLHCRDITVRGLGRLRHPMAQHLILAHNQATPRLLLQFTTCGILTWLPLQTFTSY